MWKIYKMQNNIRRREISEIIKWNWRNQNKVIKYVNNFNKEFLLKKLFYSNVWKKIKIKFEKLLRWEYVSLSKKEQELLINRNFLNSQNYISSKIKRFKLYYYSKEKIKNFKKSMIMIDKIEKDLFEQFYINFLKIIWKNNKKTWYRIYLWNKFLYLVKKIIINKI